MKDLKAALAAGILPFVAMAPAGAAASSPQALRTSVNQQSPQVGSGHAIAGLPVLAQVTGPSKDGKATKPKPPKKTCKITKKTPTCS